MLKFGLSLAITTMLGVAGTASASDLSGTPYTFSGSVISATASCPYAAKTKLAGYTLVKKAYVYRPPTYQPKPDGFSGPQLIFSPGGTADKITMKIGNLPLRSGTISGNLSLIALPNLSRIKGTYKGAFHINANNTFTLNYTSKFLHKGALCTTTYDLSFKVGIPAKFLNLL
jgi:hypothetical protein